MDAAISRPRLPAITSLRFFAALHVVIFHMWAMKIVVGPTWYQRLASIGYVGVSFFFVLSGFILVYTYADRMTPVRAFWRARFARVYPAYLFSLLITGPFFFWATLHLDIPFFAWPKAHLLTTTALVVGLLQAWVPGAALAWNSVAWSLSVEAFFYLLFPLALVYLARSGKTKLLVVAVLCWMASLAMTSAYMIIKPDGSTGINADALNYFWLNTIKFNPLVRLPEFLMGAACGFLFLRSEIKRNFALPLVLGGLAVLALGAGFSNRIPYPIIHSGLLAPGFAAIVFGIALRPAWSNVLAVRPLVVLGDASYSLYLLHVFIMGPFFFDYAANGAARNRSVGGVVMYFVVALSIAVFVYLFIENPARRALRGKPKPRPESLVTAAARAS